MTEKRLPKSVGGYLMEAAEQDDGCVPRDVVVGREVGSSGLRRRHYIDLFWRLVENVVV